MPDSDSKSSLVVNWVTEYYDQRKHSRKTQKWKSLLRPSVIEACFAVAGRIILAPIALLVLFTATKYLSDGTVLIKADNSFFAFTENDMSMAGGCTGCMGPCKIVLLKYTLFNGSAFVSSPTFNAFVALGPDPSLYDFSPLSKEALALGEFLDSDGAICQSGTNDWGATHNVVTGTSQQVLSVIKTLHLSVAPQMIRELELDMNRTDDCVTNWSMLGVTRLFLSPTIVSGATFTMVSAVDLNIFPDYTECRPVAEVNDELVGSKLALRTNGRDALAFVPEILTLFPYSFSSSLPRVSREVPAANTKYGATTVMQPLLRGYYGGCRLRAVNSTGIYIESTCEVDKHWETYGLMIHSPDDITLCSTGDICIHNYLNSLWEWINYIDPAQPNRNGMIVNSFRSRYADTVGINVLPGMVVLQILIMGLACLCQVMAHERSVLLTQIWGYRCQNGRMQVVYLAQVMYHLVYNSDLYMIGLATGTLTNESIANLTCCFFVFSYTFVNLLKARSGEQTLDRHFRLTWEAMQPAITACVGCALRYLQQNPLEAILTRNAEVLRKYSPRGAKYCGLNDACVIFKIDMLAIVTIASMMLGVVAVIASFVVKKLSPAGRKTVKSKRRSITGLQSFIRMTGSTRVSVVMPQSGPIVVGMPYHDNVFFKLTSFEEHCIGGPFWKIFRDCDDIAYTTYKNKRCTTVEALLLTGYLYDGAHIYEASSVLLLLVARILPRKIIRTFNILLLRWYLDTAEGTVTHALSCTWDTASQENHMLAGAVPIA